jgi:hypothetical protein
MFNASTVSNSLKDLGNEKWKWANNVPTYADKNTKQKKVLYIKR